MMSTHKRRRTAKGKWMQLIDPTLLKIHMEHRKIPQARLADYSGCSRQFIYQLLKGERKSCTPKLAQAIEDVLNVPRGAIFLESLSSADGPKVQNKMKARAA